MARSNKSRFAVLGILTFGEMSGYDIRKVFGKGPGHFWQESYGQIYPILRTLAAEGLVVKRTEQTVEGRPPRKVYALTPAGHAELKAWLPEPAEPQSPRNELLLKLFFGRLGGAGLCTDHIRKQESQLAAQQEQYAAIEETLRARMAKDPDARFQLMTLRYGQHVTRALLHWCQETLGELAGAAPSKPS